MSGLWRGDFLGITWGTILGLSYVEQPEHLPTEPRTCNHSFKAANLRRVLPFGETAQGSRFTVGSLRIYGLGLRPIIPTHHEGPRDIRVALKDLRFTG